MRLQRCTLFSLRAANKSLLTVLLALLGHLIWEGCRVTSQPLPLTNVTFLSYLPCVELPAQSPSGAEACDILVHVAASLAVEDINNDPNVLPGSTVNLVTITEEPAAAAVFHSSQHLASPANTLHGVIGPGVPELTEWITPITNQLNISQVSYGATDVSLSDYSFFHRDVPSVQFLSEAKLTLLNWFKWYKVGILASSEVAYARAAVIFNEVIFKSVTSDEPDLTVVASPTFSGSPDAALEELNRTGVEIIVGLFGPSDARRVLCRARDYGLTSADHVWVFSSYYGPAWWVGQSELECSDEDMAALLEHSLFLGPLAVTLPEISSAGELLPRLRARAAEWFPGLADMDLSPFLLQSWATHAYEAAWLLALAWNNTDSVSASVDDSLTTLMFCELYRLYQPCMRNTDLQFFLSLPELCASWPYPAKEVSVLARDQDVRNLVGHYYGLVSVSQLVNGTHCPMGLLWPLSNTSLEFVLFSELATHCLNATLQLPPFITNVPGCPSNFTWKGGRRPTGGFQVYKFSIDLSNLVSVDVVAGCCFAGAIVLLVLNFVWRGNKHIQASSPKLNVVIILAYVLYLPTPVLWGVVLSAGRNGVSSTTVTVCCQFSLWTSQLAEVALFGTLVVKNWRIYRIFYNSGCRELHTKSLFDGVLLVWVGLLLLPMVVLLVVWSAVDTFGFRNRIITDDITDFDFVNVIYCDSENFDVLEGCSLLYILLLNVVLIFLAYRNSQIVTRFKEEGVASVRVLIFALFVGLAMVSAVYIIESLQEDIDNSARGWLRLFWLLAVNNLLYPTIIMVLLFAPKFVMVWQDWKKAQEQRQLQRQDQLQQQTMESLRSHVELLRMELEEKESQLQSLVGSRRLKETKTASMGDDKTVEDR